jgi:hypothetical protein
MQGSARTVLREVLSPALADRSADRLAPVEQMAPRAAVYGAVRVLRDGFAVDDVDLALVLHERLGWETADIATALGRSAVIVEDWILTHSGDGPRTPAHHLDPTLLRPTELALADDVARRVTSELLGPGERTGLTRRTQLIVGVIVGALLAGGATLVALRDDAPADTSSSTSGGGLAVDGGSTAAPLAVTTPTAAPDPSPVEPVATPSEVATTEPPVDEAVVDEATPSETPAPATGTGSAGGGEPDEATPDTSTAPVEQDPDPDAGTASPAADGTIEDDETWSLGPGLPVPVGVAASGPGGAAASIADDLVVEVTLDPVGTKDHIVRTSLTSDEGSVLVRYLLVEAGAPTAALTWPAGTVPAGRMLATIDGTGVTATSTTVTIA